MSPILEIGGATYRVGKLPMLNRLQVLALLAPVLSSVAESLTRAIPALDADDSELLAYGSLLIVQAMSRLSNLEIQQIATACLAVCERKAISGWEGIVDEVETLDPLISLALIARTLYQSIGNLFAVDSVDVPFPNCQPVAQA